MRKFILSTLFLLSLLSCVHAQTNTANTVHYPNRLPATKQFTNHSLSFIENKGQVTDQYGNARHDIQFKTGSNGMSVFVGNGQLHYQFYKALTSKTKPSKHFLLKQKLPFRGGGVTPTLYEMYRLDMALEGANPHPQIITGDKQAYYENYHTTALNTGRDVVSAYNKVTYKDIYPHIDWVLYIKDNALEYDFIIRPGGNVNDIKIKYNGATDIAHTDGNIKVITPIGEVTEQHLYAYEQATHKPIAADFKLKSNTIAFSLLTTRDSRLTTYVIDPSLAWGTYFGGTGQDEAMGTACDNFGNVYITGLTSSVANIATTGAHQTIFGGPSYDVFLAKFTGANCAIQWATYYGGSSVDEGYGVTCDNAGNVYITGATGSPNNIATPGAHETIATGGDMAYLAKFNSTGAIQWGTYYGGGSSAINWGYGVTSDGTNIYICGYTSSVDSIATPGSYQDTLGGNDNTNNAFLAKFNGDGILLWGTYFGCGTLGNGCAAYSCACDAAKNVYIAGEADDSSIITTPGCYQDTFRGGSDGFIAKFDSSCHLKWSTYYGGDSGQSAQGIACDDSLNVYITGMTFSTNDIATPGAHQTVYGGGYNDAFLAKFSDSGTIQWATYYGGANDDEGEGIACDNFGNICITGYTNSANNIATPDSYLDTYAEGSDDAYLAKFSNSGLLLWATYYGDISGTEAYGVACDAGGSIYMAGGTSSTSAIATPGAYQTYYSDSSDAFLVKFDTATTGIKTVPSLFRSASLYPDPNTGDFTIIGESSDMSSGSKVEIEILNVAGQVTYIDNAILQNGQLNKQISLHNVTPGNYLMRLNIGNEYKTIKFLIQQR